MKKFTVVYLLSRRMPKETYKFELEAKDADIALFLFINHHLFRNRELFVACVVEAAQDLVFKTLDSARIITLPEFD
jgi:hypothetical protein